MALIQGAHAGIAYFGGPHWLIDDDDAKRYAQAWVNFSRHYDVEVAQKTVDTLTLLGVSAYIYVPRVFYRKPPPAPPQRGPAQIFQFAPPQPSTSSPAGPTPPAPTPHGSQHASGEIFGPAAEPAPEFNAVGPDAAE